MFSMVHAFQNPQSPLWQYQPALASNGPVLSPFAPFRKDTVSLAFAGGTVNAAPEEEWTPKRLHNTNWFRSGAILLALGLMGASQSSPIARLPTQAGALLHLLSFATWFGTMVYTTFIFGITAFKNLPRQTFGKLQAKLFPKYFSLGSICLVLQVRRKVTRFVGETLHCVIFTIPTILFYPPRS